MKSFLIPIHPEWVAKILNGEKTIEIRRNAPKDWKDYLSGKTKKKPEPMTGYIYCTKGDYLHRNKNGWFVFDMPTTFIAQEDFVTVKEQKPFNGKVVAKFTLKKVEEILALPTEIGCPYQTVTLPFKFLMKKSCVNSEGFNHYLKCKNGYAWHISDLVIFDEPKEIGQFRRASACSPNNCFGCQIQEMLCYHPTNINENYEECEKQCLRWGLTRAPQSWCYVEVL